MHDTKENILAAALRLFAEKGYDAASVSEIADKLGVTKGALYRHYRNKREIFDSIVARMAQRDAERAEAFSVPSGTVEKMKKAYAEASIDQIVQYSKAQLRYWTQDPFAADFRRILTLEQYHSAEMAQLYQQYLAGGPLGYVTDLFAEIGIAEPAREALGFYGPMFLLISVYDAAPDGESVLQRAETALEQAGAALKRKVPETR